MELVAQGIGNIGSICWRHSRHGRRCRTAANVDNGGRTPISGMVHAIVLCSCSFFLCPMQHFDPHAPTIAAILFARLPTTCQVGATATSANRIKGRRGNLLLTFTLTIVFDLVTAISISMVITIVLFMKMVSLKKPRLKVGSTTAMPIPGYPPAPLPKSVRVYEINGPMFFGMTDRITDISVKSFTKYLIIRMRGVPSLDASGMNALENLYDYCTENGVKLIFSHANEQPMKPCVALALLGWLARALPAQISMMQSSMRASLSSKKSANFLPKQPQPLATTMPLIS